MHDGLASLVSIGSGVLPYFRRICVAGRIRAVVPPISGERDTHYNADAADCQRCFDRGLRELCIGCRYSLGRDGVARLMRVAGFERLVARMGKR